MKPLYIILLLLCSITAFSQPKWSKDTLLTWNDFKAPVDQTSKFAAKAIADIHYEYRYLPLKVEGEFKARFKVVNIFNPNKSFTVVDKQTPYLLKHEQLHFDISEYFARQLKISFDTYTYT